MARSKASKTKDYILKVNETFSTLGRRFQYHLFERNHVPDVLFQYTDIQGLKGILEKKKWWATHYRYLNDGKEITYADEMISAFLEKRIEVASPKIGHLLRQIYDEVLGKQYGTGTPSVIKAYDYDIYVTSFSEAGDSLDQWRAYGANGSGYSIGIKPRELRNKFRESLILSHQDEELAFVKVVYEKNEQERLITMIVDQAEQIIQEETPLDADAVLVKQFCSHVARNISSILWQLTLIFKHPAFKNEQEWRVIKTRWGRNVMNRIDSSPIQGVLFRVGDNRLIPYLELDFSSRVNQELIPIDQIYLGPKQRYTNAQESLQMFLLSLGYAGTSDDMPELKVSEIFFQ